MNARRKAVLGIDVGGTKISGALFDFSGELFGLKVALIEGREGQEVGKLIQQLISTMLKASIDHKFETIAIGICIPGIVFKNNGTVWAPNIKGWDNYPLLLEIKSILKGKSAIPVIIESDRSCYIFGETWKGATQGCKNAIFIAVGTGIGAGIMIDGEVLNGTSGIAGAIGWLGFESSYDPKFDDCGNFEYYASGEGLINMAREELENLISEKSLLRGKKITTRAIFNAYDKGDVVAKVVIDKAIRYWGMVAANLISIFNPEKIIFGGGVFGPASKFIEDIIAEAHKWAQPIAVKRVEINVTQLDGNTGLIGAAYAALKQSGK
jgi:glucokinase